MGAELSDDGQSLRSLHTTFVAPVARGAVDISVEVLRKGRSMSQLRAEVRNPADARGHLTTAVFGSPRRGFEFTDLAPPVGFVPLAQGQQLMPRPVSRSRIW
jgi:acyl-CoA thioesterase